MKVSGYRRGDGGFGLRNHVAVIPTSVCASTVASQIAAEVSGTVALPHQHGCCQIGEDHRQTLRTLVGMARNPNVGAVLVVALGCEGLPAEPLLEAAAAAGKPTHSIVIQRDGGSAASVRLGVESARRLVTQASGLARTPGALRELVLGLECGGSDASSGLVANPVLGMVSDWLIGQGGASILSETTELIGAEHLLARRARNPSVAEALLAMVRRCEERALALGTDIRGTQPTPGNIAGGISSLEEKSLGCVYKAGKAPLQSVLAYGESPRGPGLHFMDTPGQDVESITGMVAGGAQIVLFSTGRGTPAGCPIAPVIKLTANSATAQNLPDCIDVNVADGIDKSLPLESLAGLAILEFLAIANGKLTKAELSEHHEFAIARIGPTF